VKVIKIKLPEMDNTAALTHVKEVFKHYLTCRVSTNLQAIEWTKTVEECVDKLTGREKEVIEKRYMKELYMTDYKVFNHLLYEPISKDTYTKIRNSAVAKLVVMFIENEIIQEDNTDD
jgi:hypothetical protein